MMWGRRAEAIKAKSFRHIQLEPILGLIVAAFPNEAVICAFALAATLL
jgi:hypothetical protein